MFSSEFCKIFKNTFLQNITGQLFLSKTICSASRLADFSMKGTFFFTRIKIMTRKLWFKLRSVALAPAMAIEYVKSVK